MLDLEFNTVKTTKAQRRSHVDRTGHSVYRDSAGHVPELRRNIKAKEGFADLITDRLSARMEDFSVESVERSDVKPRWRQIGNCLINILL